MRTYFAIAWLLALCCSTQAAPGLLETLINHGAPPGCGTAMSCNAPGCLGMNNGTASGDGYCTEGRCAGQPCKSTCGPAGPCDQNGCYGFVQEDSSWVCSAGDYNGCSCAPACPKADSIPSCSDADCKGASNTNDNYGICGLGKYTDCTCKNSCPATNSKCSDPACLGINNPHGGDSICLSGLQVGCPCQSECPKGKCNEIQGCSGFNNVGGNSTCTAGTFVGCSCDPICPTNPISCTANGCLGVQNALSNGVGFCTAGDYMGCSCASQCPTTPPVCTDRSCDGVKGKCTLGAAWGCACSGPDSTSDGSAQISTVGKAGLAVRLLKPGGITPRQTPSGMGIPYAYYVCMGRPGYSNPQGTDSWSRDEIRTAMHQGWRAVLNDEPIRGSNARYYPTRFHFERGWNIPAGVDRNDLYEFPLTRDAEGRMGFTRGQNPGPDRVVFQGSNGRFVGVFTHRGETGNRFHQALGHDLPVQDPEPEYEINGPTNLDLNPLPWLSMSGMSGDLPLKRNTPDTPGDIPASPPKAPSLTDLVCPLGQGEPPKTYSTDFGNNAIDWFCKDLGSRALAATGINPEAIYVYQDQKGRATDVGLIMRMYLVNGDGCSATGREVYHPSAQECKDTFTAIMNNCQPETASAKAASYQVFNKGGSGCIAFDLMPCPAVTGQVSTQCNPSYGFPHAFRVQH